MTVKDKLLVFAFGALLAANVFAPNAWARDCCKLCGFSAQVTVSTRYSVYCNPCYITICTNEYSGSANCDGGSFACDSPSNDWCATWLKCN